MKVNQNIIFIVLTLVCATLLSATASAAAPKVGVNTIVIDPGHGGRAPGTVYKDILEKDITLKVALLFGDLIKENMPGVKVIYTREVDKNVELAERGNIANKAGADLFLSIHVDAVKGTSAMGSSSFVMGMDKSKANLDVAMRENDVISYENDYSAKYEGYIPGSAESFIIFTLMQYANTDQSMQFASLIQKHYKKNTPIPDRGARQAPYLVLWKTAMPSVLTEIGFLSNAQDRNFLTSTAGQEKIARSLFNAFSEYKSKVEGKSNPLLLSDEHYSSDIAQSSSATYSPNTTTPTVPAEPEQERTSSRQRYSAEATTSKSVVNSIFFSVQVCSSQAPISLNSNTFKTYKGKVTERKIGSLYKYYVGQCQSYNEAVALQSKVRTVINGAFVVAFNGDQPCTIAQARKLSTQKQ